MTEDLQLPSMSRSSSDRSDSSIGGQKPVDKVDTKMFGSNLYWEEEILEASLIGGSEPGLLDPPQWDLDMKNASATLDLELSMDLAKKLLRVDPAMGLEGPQNVAFDSTFPPPGGVSGSILQTRCSNPRFKTEICRNFKEKGSCLYGELCQFAHGKHELRKDVVRHNKYKTKLCQKYWISGYCAYGPRCNFIHDTDRRHVMTSQSGQQSSSLRGPGTVHTAYYKTAAEVIAAVKKTNLGEAGSGQSSGSSEDGGNFSKGAPFIFSNPYRDGGSLMGLENFPTFFPRGFNSEAQVAATGGRNSCGPVGSGRPGGRNTTMPGV